MPPKAAYKKRGRKTAKSEVGKIQSIVKKAIAKNNNLMLETKQSNTTSSDGVEMFHNSMIVRRSNLLSSSQGLLDTETAQSSNRVGDKIQLKGLSIKVMFENNERYNHVSYRIFVVKSAKGDIPQDTTFFNGLSGNKMIDTLNRERYNILYTKTFTIKNGGPGMHFSGVQEIGSGYTSGYQVVSRATKICKIWVPGNKLVSKGSLIYENTTSQPKFYDYHLIYYAYSNYSTTQGSFYVGRINDEVIQLYYKDA